MSDSADIDNDLQLIETERLVKELHRRHDAVVYASLMDRDGEGTFMVAHAHYGSPRDVVFLAAKLRSVVESSALEDQEPEDKDLG